MAIGSCAPKLTATGDKRRAKAFAPNSRFLLLVRATYGEAGGLVPTTRFRRSLSRLARWQQTTWSAAAFACTMALSHTHTRRHVFSFAGLCTPAGVAGRFDIKRRPIGLATGASRVKVRADGRSRLFGVVSESGCRSLPRPSHSSAVTPSIRLDMYRNPKTVTPVRSESQ